MKYMFKYQNFKYQNNIFNKKKLEFHVRMSG